MSEPLTEERLAEIRRRVEAATGGHWVVVHDGTERSVSTTESGRFVCHLNSNMLRYSDDADFIARARQDVPDLLAEVERLRKLNAASDTEVRRLRLHRGALPMSEPVGGYCRDCRWWEQTPRLLAVGACALAEDTHEGRSLAQAIGREPGEGWLSTSAEFGCVQFEVKSND